MDGKKLIAELQSRFGETCTLSDIMAGYERNWPTDIADVQAAIKEASPCVAEIEAERDCFREALEWIDNAPLFSMPQIKLHQRAAEALATAKTWKPTSPTSKEPCNMPVEHIEQFFAYEHLPPHLQEVSKPFGDLARSIIATLPRNPERTVALRKLLESKDAAVRAKLAKDA